MHIRKYVPVRRSLLSLEQTCSSYAFISDHVYAKENSNLSRLLHPLEYSLVL